MPASALAAEIRALGCRLAINSDGRIEVSPGSFLTDALRAKVRAEREALLNLLRQEAEGLQQPPAPLRDLPAPPGPGLEPVILTAQDLAPVAGMPHAELEAVWWALASSGYARHGGAPGGREAWKFIRDAATLECLLRTREREFTAWRARWRVCLEGVYAGKVALLPGFKRDLLAAWRSGASPETDRVLCQSCRAARDAARTPEPAPKALQEDLFPLLESDS